MATYGGLDLGGTKIQAIVLEREGTHVVGEARSETPRTGGPQAVVEALTQTLGRAAEQAGLPTERLDGVGVGSPGEVDERAGTVTQARNLPDWEGSFPLATVLSERVGAKVFVGNDVSVATHAEFELGAGKHAGSLLGVFWGTGIGGGLVLDGKPWHGRGGAGEIGHMVVKRGGALCPCGRRGCLEAYAGRRAMEGKAQRMVKKGAKTDLFKLMRKHEREALTSGIWERAINHGDELAESLIERAVQALGAGIASAVNLLDVELVVLGGGLGTRFGQPMVDRIGKAMQPHLFNDGRPPQLKTAELGDLGGAIGATLLCGPASGKPARRSVH